MGEGPGATYTPRVSRGDVGSILRGGAAGRRRSPGLGWRGQFMGRLWLRLWAERELLKAPG